MSRIDGSAYRHIGEFDAAISDFNEAIRLEDDSLHWLEERKKTYETKGDHESAMAEQKKIETLNRMLKKTGKW